MLEFMSRLLSFAPLGAWSRQRFLPVNSGHFNRSRCPLKGPAAGFCAHVNASEGSLLEPPEDHTPPGVMTQATTATLAANWIRLSAKNGGAACALPLGPSSFPQLRQRVLTASPQLKQERGRGLGPEKSRIGQARRRKHATATTVAFRMIGTRMLAQTWSVRP